MVLGKWVNRERRAAMADKKKLRHSASSRNIQVTPKFRKEPDIGKLVRALISIAEKMAKEHDQKQK
jgi:hypothetical protein